MGQAKVSHLGASRRGFLATAVSGVGAAAWAAYGVGRDEESSNVRRGGRRGGGSGVVEEGRLLARPARGIGAAPRGFQPLGLESRRDGFLYVPAGYREDRPAPLVLMLHGAGGDAQN